MEELLCWLLLVLLGGLGAYLCLGYRITGSAHKVFEHREPGQPKDKLHDSRLPPMVGPRTSGITMKISSHLANSVAGQFVLMPLMLRANKFDLIRRLIIEEDPTFFPIVSPDSCKNEHKTESSTNILKDVLQKRTHTGTGFSFKCILDYTDHYRSGTLTPSQVAENIIRAIEDSENMNPPLKALVQWDQKLILKMADASTARYRAKTPLSPLDGVPVCIKEELKVVPFHYRAGTVFLGKEPETSDATITKKLREAGAIILGVTNMHELGIGTTGCNPNRFHGTARNPYNPQHFTGGSSSGSAAAVAAGLCPLAIGTDGGGSVRIPATFCGIVGLKGTFGRISCNGGLPLSFSTVSAGPLCSSVQDAMIAYALLAVPDPKYPHGLLQPPVSFDGVFTSDLKGLKLGIDWDFFKDCNPEIAEACQQAVEHLKCLGASIVDIRLPEMEEARLSHVICILSEMRAWLEHDFTKHYNEMNLDTRSTLAMGSKFTAVDYIQASRQKTRTMKFLKDLFVDVNCILTPGTACTASAILPSDLITGQSDITTLTESMKYCQLGNFTGIPCLVIPVGYSSAGLPISIQVMAKWWDEAVLFRVGLKLEEFRTETKKPIIYYDTLF